MAPKLGYQEVKTCCEKVSKGGTIGKERENRIYRLGENGFAHGEPID
jgi:hypothetical protein